MQLKCATAYPHSLPAHQVHEHRYPQNGGQLAIAPHSTIRNANRIVVLERGQIVEVGNHSNLLTNNGTYAQMYEKLA